MLDSHHLLKLSYYQIFRGFESEPLSSFYQAHPGLESNLASIYVLCNDGVRSVLGKTGLDKAANRRCLVAGKTANRFIAVRFLADRFLAPLFLAQHGQRFLAEDAETGGPS